MSNLGGGWSLVRTVLWSEFPTNRENYREILGLRLINLPAELSKTQNTRKFLAINLAF